MASSRRILASNDAIFKTRSSLSLVPEVLSFDVSIVVASALIRVRLGDVNMDKGI
jgi:hypothetical protein